MSVATVESAGFELGPNRFRPGVGVLKGSSQLAWMYPGVYGLVAWAMVRPFVSLDLSICS